MAGGDGVIYYVARGLQMIGLIEVGFGLFIGLYEGDLKLELWHGGIGSVLFFAGWLVQKRFSR
jgi:hypothetical protein